MRLFVAVDVGPDVRAHAARVREALESRDPDAARRGLRWVDPRQLHLTLRFVGEVNEPLGREVVTAIDGHLDRAAFTVAFGLPRWLPGPTRPRVLMLPVASGADALLAVKQAVEARLPGAVPPDDPRPFQPHLTLARVRDDWRERVRTLTSAFHALPASPSSGRIDEAVLYESHLGPAGPVYHERARLRWTATP